VSAPVYAEIVGCHAGSEPQAAPRMESIMLQVISISAVSREWREWHVSPEGHQAPYISAIRYAVSSDVVRQIYCLVVNATAIRRFSRSH